MNWLRSDADPTLICALAVALLGALLAAAFVVAAVSVTPRGSEVAALVAFLLLLGVGAWSAWRTGASRSL